MNKFCIKLIIVIVFLLFYSFSSAQNYYDDAQLWIYINLEKKVTKKFTTHLKLQDRMINNFSEIGQLYADIGVAYKLNKNIKFTADYVFAERKKNSETYKDRHSFYAALILKKEIGHWQLSYRNMFQCRYKSPFTSKDGYNAYYYDRNKVIVKYEASKRLSFYIAEEVNIPLNNPQIKGLSRSRSYAGIFVNTSKHQQLEFYYMYQVQLQQGNWYKQDISYPNTLLNRKFVFGIGYQIDF